ncbi:polysaccharide deacetylase family protein [Spirosoma sp.]|uniref:polysaccharide deacetylase family protein n=1 Tax=Spirosoma sp. TaxID=1899569 RepID=UPI0026103AC7|nr:polysaccharide deacetylase family protein [Spirosoma sp.]MCX6216757.1 polysaccharide deacetylase family protein [Spirosoma sp.]
MWWHKFFNRTSASKALILMYHRVDTLPCDPWQLAVSAENFEQQLAEICQYWRPISLPELRRDIAARSVKDRSVVLTFDDGYIDNFVQAKPLLEKYKVPATFFIATRHCESQAPFWWDELQTILVDAPKLPDLLQIPIGNELLTADLSSETVLTPLLREKQKTWAACVNTPTERCSIYEKIWQRLKTMSAEEQQVQMARLREWAVLPNEIPATLRCMTPDHLHALASNSLFTIGSHTMNHPALGERPAREQATEISGGNQYLHQQMGSPVKVFAYPYGNYNETSVTLVREEGLSTAVTTEEGAVTSQTNPLRLNRFQVCNWDKPTFGKKLDAWYSRS